MDSKALLDYALFQLTPTRTRCDLVVFSGKKSEKLASGLVDPFISHLKYAKDQIPKGGYSITLRPPATDEDAHWFTKATFQRFVRFVSTPEILERITRIEREILQIDSSIQSNEVSNKDGIGRAEEGTLTVVNGFAKKSNSSTKLNSEIEDGAAAPAPEENSKARLQRLMDSRKAILQKEQAMAYARSVVAGYEMDTIDDLICFADAFGASRLRDACIEFKELYKKKHSDDQWMDELAAVKAYPVADLSYMANSGIMLAGETPLLRTFSSDMPGTPNSDGSKETSLPGSEQTPNMHQQGPWMNQIPQYMYNFQGYPLMPGMHPGQPYYPGHMGWPNPAGIVPPKNRKSSRRKEKSLDANGTDAPEEDELTPSSESFSGSDSEKANDKQLSKSGHRRSKQKSSKTVVIRNINYITSQRRNGEDGEDSDNSSDSLDESSIREGVDNAIASLEKRKSSKTRKNRRKWGSVPQNGYAEQDSTTDIDTANNYNPDEGKTTNAWDAFQNLLVIRDEPNEVPRGDASNELSGMRNTNNGHPNNNLYMESESMKIKPLTTDDSVLVMQREGANFGKNRMVDFVNGQDVHPNARKIISEDGNPLFSQFPEESRTNAHADFSAEMSTLRTRRGQDWFGINSSGGSEAQGVKHLDDILSYERGISQKENPTRTTMLDDSFMIESRSAVDEQYVSPWRTDISMDADIAENGSANISADVKAKSTEPDEFSMMLVRESQESTGAAWTPEMDYEVEISFTEVDKKPSIAKATEDATSKNVNGKKSVGPSTKTVRSKPLTGSISKSRLDSLSKSKKMPPASRSMVQKSKFEKEEEERKRLEELVLQRQKRIAERSASTGLTSSGSKKVPVGNKAVTSKRLSI